MDRRLIARITFGAAVLATSLPAFAATETTCLCRADDGKSFKPQLNRHHRWACDYHFGYIRAAEPGETPDPALPVRRRPKSETCNIEEVIQFKVYLCARGGCTYPYSKASETENRALKKILPLKGERRP